MSNCSSTCETKDHETLGQCLRDKGLRIGWANSAAGVDLSAQKRWDSRLSEYRAARAQGIQPKSSKLKDIRAAVDHSNATGTAFKAA